MSRQTFEIKADKKSIWAYRELKALLYYAYQQNLDPLTIKGSYAGAIGIPQFMPSSLIALAIDGNNDGTINLFEHCDAIYSIANYLKYHGWFLNIEQQEAFKILLHYNNSSYYANTIIKITELLKR
jgi:membrane-bound lytic murein transglycosylase B